MRDGDRKVGQARERGYEGVCCWEVFENAYFYLFYKGEAPLNLSGGECYWLLLHCLMEPAKSERARERESGRQRERMEGWEKGVLEWEVGGKKGTAGLHLNIVNLKKHTQTPSIDRCTHTHAHTCSTLIAAPESTSSQHRWAQNLFALSLDCSVSFSRTHTIKAPARAFLSPRVSLFSCLVITFLIMEAYLSFIKHIQA